MKSPGYDLFKFLVALILAFIAFSDSRTLNSLAGIPSTSMTAVVVAPTAGSATETAAAPQPTPGSTPGAGAASEDCTPLAPTRLRVGARAVTEVRVNLRSSPGFGDNWIVTLPRHTQVNVTGGPQCTQEFLGAYQWWRVETDDGQAGWAAEAALWRLYYFLGPVNVE